MKNLLLITALIFAYFNATAESEIKVSKTKYSTTYIPRGFDSNDFVQFVAEGFFPDSCSRWAWTDVRVDHVSKTIQIAANEYRYPGPCAEMIVPHNETINVGILKEGVYRVVQYDGTAMGIIPVHLSRTSTPDDYVYAPVSQAYASVKDGRLFVTISGAYTSSCYKLGEIMTTVEPNVVTVQPLSDRVYTFVPCQTGRFDFEKTVEVKGVKPGRYLLHVRSLDGKSTNTIFDMF